MAKILGPYPFLFDGEPTLSAISLSGRYVRIVIREHGENGLEALSIAFQCDDPERIMRAVRAFNDEMNRVETSEAAE